MSILSGKNFIKAAAITVCAAITAGSLTYVDCGENIIHTEARTVSEIEAEKAENQAEIDAIQKEIDGLKNDVAEQEAYQEQLQQKIDLQNKNIENVNKIINDLNTKIEEKEDKIGMLEDDIAAKEADIENGLELFKERLRAMYISGNDSLVSALVGSTDFYDMLSKMELISQVAKHDDELIDSLNTQLEQYKEAQAQLDIEKAALDSDLSTQEANRQELRDYIEDLQYDYQQSSDYIELKKADMASQQRNIDDLQADNEAMEAEAQAIQDEIDRQRQLAIQADEDRQSSYSYDDDDDDDYYEDDDDDDYSGSSGGGSSSGGGGSSGSSGGSSSGGGGGGFTWPVPGFYGISSGYGYRWGSNHNGIDIAGGGIAGATVVAAGSGTVILAKTGCSHNYGKDGSCGCNGGYGNYLVIDHGNGITTLYGHCADVYASVGQYVSIGEAIGSVGSTGWSTGFHCHFQLEVGGSPVDPTSYVY